MRNIFKRRLNNALSPWRYVRWAARIAVGIFCLVVLGLAVGTIYQAIFGNIDEKRYEPPGRLVDIGGTTPRADG